MTAPGAGPSAGDGFVDLQTHSTASDGALPPARVVEEAARVGLVAIALTDHDTMAGLAEAAEVGARLGVRIVNGVELSTVFRRQELHLLGLHLRDFGPLEAMLADYRVARRARAEQIVARLVSLGVTITMDDVERQATGPAIGRPHVARALVARGAVADLRQAFDKWLGSGRPAFVDKKRLEVADGIAAIHAAGGLAVWAHPGRDGTKDALRGLADLGLDGVEVFHPGHTPDDRLRIAKLADELGLLKSGGSDWHGQFDGPRQLGNQQVPAAWLAAQDARVAARAAGAA